MLNKSHALRQFDEFVNTFPETSKTKLKQNHSYHVADLCEEIAKALNLSERQVDIAWLSGLLHDVGRFEQITRYNTFRDRESIDHAALSEQILFSPKNETIWDYVLGMDITPIEKILLSDAIKQHSRAYISPIKGQIKYYPDNLIYHNILRDADKIDILRYSRYDLISDCQEEDAGDYTVECLNYFCDRKIIPHEAICSIPNNYLYALSFIYQMNYVASVVILKDKRYINAIIDDICQRYPLPGCITDMLNDYGFGDVIKQ